MRALLPSLYRLHRQGLYTLALSIVGDGQAAEDAVHDAFTRLWERQSPPQGDAVAYVFASVRNAAVDHLRRRRRSPGPQGSIYAASPAAGPGPDATVLDAERDELLRRAVEELPDAQRQAVILRLYAGLTFEQMSQITGEPLSTVSTRYRRALEELRKSLEMKV